MQESLVNYLLVHSFNRLDAEYFQQKYFKPHKKQSIKKLLPLKQFCEFIKTGPSGSLLSALNYVSEGINGDTDVKRLSQVILNKNFFGTVFE